jgi:co-chaperonin GroES (HSP10)
MSVPFLPPLTVRELNVKPTKNTKRRLEVPDGSKQRIPASAKGKAPARKVPRLQARHSGDGNSRRVPKVRNGARGAGVLPVRGSSRPHHDRESNGDANTEQRAELTEAFHAIDELMKKDRAKMSAEEEARCENLLRILEEAGWNAALDEIKEGIPAVVELMKAFRTIEPKLIFRPGWVRVESLPDDFRNAPLNYNLRQTLVIPDCAKEPSRLAKVLALGPDTEQNGERYEYSVAPGDIVLCNRYPQSFQRFRWKDELFEVLKEDEILSKVVTNG